MIKKITLLALVTVTISSCSTYSGFGKRKYYNFQTASTEVINKSVESENTKYETVTANNEENNIGRKAVISIVEAKETENSPSNSIINKKPFSASNYQTISIESWKQSLLTAKSKENFVQTIKHKSFLPVETQHRPGRLWWVWAIGAFVSLILMLFASAYIGLIFFLGTLTLTIIYLIKYIIAKHAEKK